MNRERTVLTADQYAVKEKTYQCGAELFQAVMVVIGQTYSPRKREPYLGNNMPNPEYDSMIGEEYTKAVERARRLLNEQRNIVNDKACPRYRFTLRAGAGADHGPAYHELHGWLVEGILDRLYQNFVQWSHLLVAPQYDKPLQETLRRLTFGVPDTNIAGVKQTLSNFLDRYHVELLPGQHPLAVAYDGAEIDYAVRPSARIPQPRHKGR